MPRNPTATSRWRRRITITRLTQRLIAAVSAPTAEGVLYELDLRLRPSGNKGPVATHIDAFQQIPAQEAWTWEHMALTRARAVAGDAGLAPRRSTRRSPPCWPSRATRPRCWPRPPRCARMIEEGKAAARRLGHQAGARRADRSRIHRPGGRAHRQPSKPAHGRPATARCWRACRRISPTADSRQELVDAYRALSGADPDDRGSA